MEISFAKGLWLYENKIKEKTDERNENYKKMLMLMDWIAKCMTGQDTRLVQKYNEIVERNETSLPDKKDKTIEERVKEEDDLLSSLRGLGFKIKEN